MKKIVLLVLMAGLVQFSQAQIKFGVTGGLNVSKAKLSNIDEDKYNIVENDAGLGYHFGLFLRLGEDNLSLQSELVYTKLSGDVAIDDKEDGYRGTEYLSQSFQKIDIPILIGKKVGPIRFHVGPVASFLLDADFGFDQLDQIKEKAKPATWGYQAGAGVDFNKLSFDVRYEGSLSKWGESVTIGSESFAFDQRNPSWIFALSYAF